MTLIIPENHHEPMKLLNELSVDDVEELSNLFDSAPVTFSVKRIANFIIESDFSKIKKEYIYGITDLLVNLQYVKYDTYSSSIELFIDEVIESVEESVKSDVKWDHLKLNLQRLLIKDNSLLITAKALNVMTDYSHTFRNARILTDARHIFSDEVGDETSLATMVTHTLKIDHSVSGGRESVYIAMDSNDIKGLQKSLDRALRKESNLKAIARENDMPFLDSALLLED